MLRIPSQGLQRSVNRHNCRIDILADWVEGSALFTETRISKTDVVDMLLEEEAYREQDFAAEYVADIWLELQNRVRLGRISALSIDARGVEPNRSWEAVPAYSFALHWLLEIGSPALIVPTLSKAACLKG